MSKTSSNQFFTDLAIMLMHGGVPLERVSQHQWNLFWKKCTEIYIPYKSTLRKKYVSKIFDSMLLKIKEIVGQSPMYLFLDETMDAICLKYTSWSFNWRAGKTNVI